MRFGWAVLYVSEKQFILSAIVVETEEGSVCVDIAIYNILYVCVYIF